MPFFSPFPAMKISHLAVNETIVMWELAADDCLALQDA